MEHQFRMRMTLFFAVAAMVVGLMMLGKAAFGAAVPSAIVQPARTDPAEQFRADAAKLFANGYELRDLSIDTLDRGRVALGLTLVKARRAYDLNLVIDNVERESVSYEKSATSAPADKRVYRFASQLARTLAAGAIREIEPACDGFFIAGALDGAFIDENDYYVVTRQVKGRHARVALPAAVRQASRDGMVLVDVNQESSQTARFQFVGDGGEREIVASLDKQGLVVGLEIRRSPMGGVWQQFAKPQRLNRSLGRSVSQLSFTADGGLVLRSNQGEFLIRQDDFRPVEASVQEQECEC